MRENMGLHRGKRLDNGEWVEGAFCPKNCDLPFGPMVDRPSIIKLDEPCDGFWFDVDPATVGQYIGKVDINEKGMFEGDVVKTASFVAVVGYSPAYAAFALEIWYKGKFDDVLLFNDKLVGDLEIIGNIYDNPELLEVQNE